MAGRNDSPPRWTTPAVEGEREATAIAATLGRDARATRRLRRRTQRQVSRRVGISHTRVSQLERGLGANAPLALWVKLGIALGRPLAVSFSRELAGLEPADIGHLAAQELILELAAKHGWAANVELATRPADPRAWADVVFRDDPSRTLILIEIVNRAGNLGADFRSTDRKAADLERTATVIGGDEGPYRVAAGWLLVDSAANRALIRRYPQLFRARFPGSSRRFAAALTNGSTPPTNAAVAWLDLRTRRIYPLRIRP